MNTLKVIAGLNKMADLLKASRGAWQWHQLAALAERNLAIPCLCRQEGSGQQQLAALHVEQQSAFPSQSRFGLPRPLQSLTGAHLARHCFAAGAEAGQRLVQRPAEGPGGVPHTGEGAGGNVLVVICRWAVCRAF